MRKQWLSLIASDRRQAHLCGDNTHIGCPGYQAWWRSVRRAARSAPNQTEGLGYDGIGEEKTGRPAHRLHGPLQRGHGVRTARIDDGPTGYATRWSGGMVAAACEKYPDSSSFRRTSAPSSAGQKLYGSWTIWCANAIAAWSGSIREDT
jgi:hypothetical protein